jgi:pyruvate/2-oxoglutarate dehydrogenase complex dihydrolipoamide dehydrogenase (E3) component
VSREFDVVVIGGGAAGITVAREGARRGARTVLVQDGPVGGDCTFTGCVPSKTLLVAAARGESFGEAMAAVRLAVARIAASEDDLALKRDGVSVIHGRAALRLAAANSSVTARTAPVMFWWRRGACSRRRPG